VHPDDWLRIAELVSKYPSSSLGMVDASVIAAAERLEITTVATSAWFGPSTLLQHSASCRDWPRPRTTVPASDRRCKIAKLLLKVRLNPHLISVFDRWPHNLDVASSSLVSRSFKLPRPTRSQMRTTTGSLVASRSSPGARASAQDEHFRSTGTLGPRRRGGAGTPTGRGTISCTIWR